MKTIANLFIFLVILSVSCVASLAQSSSIRGVSSQLSETVNAYILDNLDKDEDGLELTKEDVTSFNTELSFGDLTGDGKEEAAVFTTYFVGGTGASGRNRVFVYTLENSDVKLLTILEGGDRAFGGIRNAKIVGTQLHIETFTPTPDECAACYGGVYLTKYIWRNTKLRKAGGSYLGNLILKNDQWILKRGVASKSARSQRPPSEGEIMGPKPRQTSAGVLAVIQYLRGVLDDPYSMKLVSWSRLSKVNIDSEPYWYVRLRFRAKNKFGAYVLSTYDFFMRHNKVVRASAA